MAGFSIFGESSLLVQVVPSAFAATIAHALAARGGGLLGAPDAGSGALGVRVLHDVTLRVWAELGRAELPVGRAAGLGRGSVIELDRDVDDPVDVYANGRRIGTGRLLLIEQDEWAVQLEHLFATDPVAIEGETPRQV
jgi:flagellar motor switch protein FliN